MATTYYNDLQKLYVAYFNRPADSAGLAYYETVMEGTKGDAKAIAATLATISAGFAASAEYKAAYANKSNADVVNTVYLNLFGRAAEQAGKDYWAGLLDAKKVTVDFVVTQIAGGAQGSDLVAFNNKVAASVAFTAALGTTNAYSGDNANAVAKLFLSGITDNASFSTATDTYALGATVAKVNAAGTTFSLQSGLAALDAANATKAAFLDAADGKADGTTDPNAEQKISDAIAAKIGAIDTLVAGDYTNSSVGVRAALLADQQAANATKLTGDQKAVADATTDIAKVAGLSDAIAALTAANTAVTNATAADKAAAVDLAAKLAAYNAQNGTTLTVAADGQVAGLITVDTKGNLVLANGVTEAKNPGVTALLASSAALEAADAALASTKTAQVTAQTNVNNLDLSAASQADLKTLAGEMTYVKLAAGATPTIAQITTELAQLDAVRKSTADIAGQATATDAQKAAAADALAAYNTFKLGVDKFYADDVDANGANINPLQATLKSATDAVTADQKAITDLAKALTDLATANTTKAQLDAVNGQVKAALDAFTDNSLVQPVPVAGTQVATAGADIYNASAIKADASILNFGLLGNDALYLGNKYTLNTTGDITKGNDAVLEAFIVKTSTGTNIVLEQKAFASSETNPGTDLITITLTGVDSTKVHLNNGIITVA